MIYRTFVIVIYIYNIYIYIYILLYIHSLLPILSTLRGFLSPLFQVDLPANFTPEQMAMLTENAMDSMMSEMATRVEGGYRGAGASLMEGIMAESL